VSPIVIIPAQEFYSTTVGNLRELYKAASSALQDYITKKEVCYGFILRSVNSEQTGEHSDLFIESSLMRTIRKTWYENNLIDRCHKFNWDKLLAITLYAYLDSQNYTTFSKLFPEYDSYFNVYTNYINDVVNEMVQKTIQPTYEIPMHTNIVNFLLQSFKNNIRLDTRGQSRENLTKIYLDYIRHPEALDVIMTNSAEFLKTMLLKNSNSN
jgi:hypothetical protein